MNSKITKKTNTLSRWCDVAWLVSNCRGFGGRYYGFGGNDQDSVEIYVKHPEDHPDSESLTFPSQYFYMTDDLIEINERFLRELNIPYSVRGILPSPDDFARQIIESSPSRPSDKKLQIFCNHCFENRGSGSAEYCYLDGYAVDKNFLEGIVFKITINSKTNKLEVVPSARYDEKYLRNLNYEKYMDLVNEYVEKKWNEISFECSNCGRDAAVIEEV